MTRTTLLAFLLLLAPAYAYAGPGDATPDFGDDDDEEEEEEAPESEADEEAEEEDAEAEEEDAEAPAEPERDDDSDRLDLPELSPDTEEAEEESEEDLDDRYRVVVPGSEEPDVAEEDTEEKKAEILDERKRRGLVKVIQKKFFLKYRRVEVVPQVGYVGNDHFIRRIGVGATIGYHINEVLSLEVLMMYLPDLKETDYKPLTKQFRDNSEVVPDISRITFLGALNFQLSPIYGKVELGTLRIINYDLYFGAGIGLGATKDDTFIIRSPCDQYQTRAERKQDVANGCQYVDQTHFVTNAGGGLRVVFNDWIGIRLDVRQFTHIEQVYREGDIGLEMKQNLMISLGASLFFPPKARALPL
ncbi:MAG: outer membrane beta-barrel domain-containing protein [Proteobacteria bacterium]|nr:outer membrane beta-barrel domain-containing protein [Pseudomonadota bacterium]